MATLKQIAEIVQVSTSTVSRTLNNDSSLNISNETRTKIISVANELGYRGKKAIAGERNVAIINWYNHDQEVIDPYYYAIRVAATQYCEECGFKTSLVFKGDEYNTLANIDGIIAIGKFCDEQIKEMSIYSQNIVFVDYNPGNVAYDCVIVDFEEVMSNLIKQLTSLGYTKLALLSGQEYIGSSQLLYKDMRFVTFQKMLKKMGLYQNKYVRHGRFDMDSGFEMMDEIILQGDLPEVVICANDSIAIGANKSAYNHGLVVGCDISIVGINNIPVTKYIVPSLTTVEIFQKQMGQEAVRLLIARLEDPTSIGKVVMVSTQLKIRKSVKGLVDK